MKANYLLLFLECPPCGFLPAACAVLRIDQLQVIAVELYDLKVGRLCGLVGMVVTVVVDLEREEDRAGIGVQRSHCPSSL